MTNRDKNIAIALMLGAVVENWYPANKDNDTTGNYYIFPERTWYPNNTRQHGDYGLRFDSDYNWMLEALKFITKKYDAAWKLTSKFCEIHNHSNGFDCRCEINCPENPMLDMFECLYQYSQYLKTL